MWEDRNKSRSPRPPRQVTNKQQHTRTKEGRKIDDDIQTDRTIGNERTNERANKTMQGASHQRQRRRRVQTHVQHDLPAPVVVHDLELPDVPCWWCRVHGGASMGGGSSAAWVGAHGRRGGLGMDEGSSEEEMCGKHKAAPVQEENPPR